MGGSLARSAGDPHPYMQAVCVWLRVCHDGPGGLLGTRADLTKTRTPTTTKQVNMGQLTLARRLRFSCNDSMWASEAGWRVRMVFAWQRLVRAGKIQHARHHSAMWRESEQNRIITLAEQHRLTLRSNEDWEDQSLQARGQRYAWDLEASIQAQQGVNNGAAAVMARRRQHSGSPGGTQPVVAGSSAHHARTGRDKRPRSDNGPQHATRWDGTRPQGEPDILDDAAGDPARNASTAQRHAGDGLLVFTTRYLYGALRPNSGPNTTGGPILLAMDSAGVAGGGGL